MDHEDVATGETTAVTTEDASMVEVTTVLDDNEIPANSDDVIELNVGGQRITTFRSTLTAIPNSHLALLFDREHKIKTYFFDYNPVQFQYLLDQLRTMRRKPPKPLYELNFVAPVSQDIRFDFSDMLVELGLTRKLNSVKYHIILLSVFF